MEKKLDYPLKTKLESVGKEAKEEVRLEQESENIVQTTAQPLSHLVISQDKNPNNLI